MKGLNHIFVYIPNTLALQYKHNTLNVEPNTKDSASLCSFTAGFSFGVPFYSITKSPASLQSLSQAAALQESRGCITLTKSQGWL